MLRGLLLGSCVALCLAACAQTQKRTLGTGGLEQVYQARADYLQTVQHWSVEGRLAISDGNDGGSGRLFWEHDSDASQLSFRGALGQGAWQLDVRPDAALLEIADGRVYRAATVAELVLTQVGWKVPVDALAWWIRGMAMPPGGEQRELDDQGRLKFLQQVGWSIEFGKYLQHAGTWLPSRLTARRDAYSVKLAVRAWNLGPSDDATD